MLYRIECIDRDTGQRFELRVEAESPAAAAKVGMRDGVVVGQVLTVPHVSAAPNQQPPQPPPKSPLFERPVRTIALGIWLGNLMLAGTGLVITIVFWAVTGALLAGVMASCPRPSPPKGNAPATQSP